MNTVECILLLGVILLALIYALVRTSKNEATAQLQAKEADDALERAKIAKDLRAVNDDPVGGVVYRDEQ